MKWLTERAAVPEKNLHLMLSPLIQERTSQLNFEYSLPTRENIEQILFKELPAQDGDLLWIYWAGHGYLDASHQLLLPYYDATADWTKHLNLEAALRWWKTARPAKGRFPRQIIIGDACRVDANAARNLTFGQTDYGSGRPDSKRRQFTLYAAHAGEMAQNLADRGAGQFTDVLLQQLDKRTLDDTVRQLVSVAQAVQADLQVLRAQNRAWQHPQFVIDRDWSDSSIFGDRWIIQETAESGAMRLDQIAWQGLAPLLAERTPPAHSYDAYRWAFEISDCIFPAHQGLPTGGLAGITRDLNSRQGRHRDMPLVMPFMRYLAARSSDASWSRVADEWITSTCERLRTSAVPIPPGPEPEPPSLHVQLRRDEQRNGQYWLRMWTYHGNAFEAVWESDDAVDITTVKARLGEQLMTKRAYGLSRIEFHTPYELLVEEFESWRLPIGRRGKPVVLGHVYEIVMRCPDERDGIAGEHWRRKWDWFKVHGGLHPKAVHSLTDDQVSTSLSLHLQADAPPVCILAEVSSGHLMDTLDAVLDSGVPIAVWSRSYGQGTAARYVTQTLNDAGLMDLNRLPRVLKMARIPQSPGLIDSSSNTIQPMALMWDDPERVPERRPLT